MPNPFCKHPENKKGFTLIELIVVIAILGTLTVLAVPRFMRTLDNSKIQAHNANVRTIESAVSIYQAEKGTAAEDMDDIDVLIPDYLDENPTDPRSDTSDAYSITDGVVSPAAE